MKIGLTKHQPDFFVTTLYDLLSLVRSVTLYEIAYTKSLSFIWSCRENFVTLQR